MEQENKKNNLILWIALAIPVIALILVAIFAYMPSNFTAKYDFLYTVRDYNYNYNNCFSEQVYAVKNQQIIISSVVQKNSPISDNCLTLEKDPPKIYRYDVSTDTKEQISFVDAQKLQLDNNKFSSDDISVQRGRSNNTGIFEIFGGNSNYNNIYFRKNNNEYKKLNLNLNNGYDFIFIGWVLK